MQIVKLRDPLRVVARQRMSRDIVDFLVSDPDNAAVVERFQIFFACTQNSFLYHSVLFGLVRKGLDGHILPTVINEWSAVFAMVFGHHLCKNHTVGADVDSVHDGAIKGDRGVNSTRRAGRNGLPTLVGKAFFHWYRADTSEGLRYGR